MICFLRPGVAVLVRQPFAIRRRAPFLQGMSLSTSREPPAQCAPRNATFSVMLCLDRSLCAVMISFVFSWRLIENETMPLWKTQRVLLECASYGLDSVVSCGIESVTPDLLWIIPTKHSEMVAISLRIVVWKDIYVATSRRELPSLMGVSLILVQVSSSTDLSVTFSKMSLVFCSTSSN